MKKNIFLISCLFAIVACEPELEHENQSSSKEGEIPVLTSPKLPVVEKIYPNPCSDVLNIDKGSPAYVKYTIIYPDKATMINGAIDKFTNSINILKLKLPNGEYEIRFTDSMETKKSDFYLKVDTGS